MLVNGLAPVLAPTIGSAVLRFGSWRTIFVVLAAFGAVLLLVTWLRLPETLPAERRGPGGLARRPARLRGASPGPGLRRVLPRSRPLRRSRVCLHRRLVVRPAGRLRPLSGGVRPHLRRQRDRHRRLQPGQPGLAAPLQSAPPARGRPERDVHRIAGPPDGSRDRRRARLRPRGALGSLLQLSGS